MEMTDLQMAQLVEVLKRIAGVLEQIDNSLKTISAKK
jgi:hypothetical protein